MITIVFVYINFYLLFPKIQNMNTKLKCAIKFIMN